MLAGFNPRTIMDLARAGLNFWTYQKKHEINVLKHKINFYRSRSIDVSSSKNEVESKYKQLQGEYEKIKKQKHDLDIELTATKEEVFQIKQRLNKFK